MRKKIQLMLILLCAFVPIKAHAIGGYSYVDQAGILTNVTFPLSIEKTSAMDDNNVNLSTLKRGEATSRAYFDIVEVGNAGIDKASKKANITKIRYVDAQYNKIYIPLGFIPIKITERKTIVYGE